MLAPEPKFPKKQQHQLLTLYPCYAVADDRVRLLPSGSLADQMIHCRQCHEQPVPLSAVPASMKTC